MKKGLICLTCLLFAISTTAIAGTYVRGYTKSNGTYVAPHYRSSPNSTTYDNYSTKGNYNPYTGQKGTQNPYKSNSNSFNSGNTYQNSNPYGRSSNTYSNPYKY